jgi:hypothetical protein
VYPELVIRGGPELSITCAGSYDASEEGVSTLLVSLRDAMVTGCQVVLQSDEADPSNEGGCPVHQDWTLA